MNTVTTSQPQVLDFDPAALREKYDTVQLSSLVAGAEPEPAPAAM